VRENCKRWLTGGSARKGKTEAEMWGIWGGKVMQKLREKPPGRGEERRPAATKPCLIGRENIKIGESKNPPITQLGRETKRVHM